MKLLPRFGLGAGAALLLGLASCQSQAQHSRDHWTAYSIGPRMSRAFLTYNPETDGDTSQFFRQRRDDIRWTVRRHLFNHNPDNPFQAAHQTNYELLPIYTPPSTQVRPPSTQVRPPSTQVRPPSTQVR